MNGEELPKNSEKEPHHFLNFDILLVIMVITSIGVNITTEFWKKFHQFQCTNFVQI